MKSKGAELHPRLHQLEARNRPAISAAPLPSPTYNQYPSSFPPPLIKQQPHDQLLAGVNNAKPSSSCDPSPSSSSSKPALTPLPTACAGCRFQRRRCLEQCELAPYFPANEDVEFEAVHGLFGVKNFVSMLKSITSLELRHAAAFTMKAEAKCRQADPVRGATGVIIDLQDRIKEREEELLKAQTVLDAVRRQQQLYRMQASACPAQPFQNSSSSASAYHNAASSQMQFNSSDKSLSLDDLGCSTSSQSLINSCEHINLNGLGNYDPSPENLINLGQSSMGFNNLDISSRSNIISPSLDRLSQSIGFDNEDIIPSPYSQRLTDQLASSQTLINSYDNSPSTPSTGPYYDNLGLDSLRTSSNALLGAEMCDKSNQLNCSMFFNDIG